MGKRKSNKCCIFHKRKKFGESSSESEYSSGAESGSDSPRRSDRAGARRQREKCSCEPGDEASTPMQQQAAGAASSRRGPFTRRVQDSESAATGGSAVAFPQSPLFSMCPSSVLALSPLSLGDNREMISDAAGGAPAAALSLDDAAVAHELWVGDLLTDAAAVERIQSENIYPSNVANAFMSP